MNPALAQAEQEFASQPEDANLAVHLAHLLLVDGQHARALTVARRAAELAPTQFRVVRFLSGVAAVAGQPELALQAAEQAIRLSPADAEVRLHVAGLLLVQQRPADAVVHLLAATRLPDATGVAWRMLSGALLELGRHDRAIEAVSQAILQEPNTTEFRVHRASLLIGRGRLADAQEELSVALEMAPDDASVWRARSGLLDIQGDITRAIADAERAVALRPQEPEYHAHLRHLRLYAGIPVDADDAAGLDAMAADWLRTAPRPQRRPRPPTGPITALREMGRVIDALILRDMRTRFGHTNLGYVWALVEPIMHLLTLGSVFAWLNHAKPPLGNSLYLFYVTGLIPYLLFSHVSANMIHTLSNNSELLQIPIVKRMDVVLSNSLLALATETVVSFIVFFGFYILGYQAFPADLLTCIQAVLALWGFSLGLGLINMVVAHFLRAWEQLVTSSIQLMYFASGIYYSANMMPTWVRDILIWNPVLQAIEWFRSGFYTNYHPHWLDRTYLVTCGMVALAIGLALERTLRQVLAKTS